MVALPALDPTLGLHLSRTHLPIAGIVRHADEIPDSIALVDADPASAATDPAAEAPSAPGSTAATLTYAEFWDRIRLAAARLAATGVRPGDRVAIVAGNCATYAVVVYAAQYLGAIIVPVNFRLAAGEVAYILADSAPVAVVVDEERRATVEAALAANEEQGSAAPGTPASTAPATQPTLLDLDAVSAGQSGTGGQGASGAGDDLLVPAPAVPALDDDQAIMYTSGTTGRPKGAVLSYSNFLSTTMRSSASWGYVPGRDSVLIGSPMFHIAAFNVLTTSLANGARCVVTPSSGFDAGGLLDVMAAHGVTRTFMVPAQWQMLADEQGRNPRDVSLQFWSWGAAPATEALLEQMTATFPGSSSQAAFGQTETSASGVSLSHEDSVRKLGSVGVPDRNFSIRVVQPGIVDVDADGNEQLIDVAPGEVGEIVYRGPGVMSRYWNRPEATAEAFAGGWFHSGDLVRQDEEGFLYVVDRVKDMIISGGENIYCAELENVIAWHPKVAEVAVVGRADERWGEVPVAIIVPTTDTDTDTPPTLDEIRDFCDGKLARYKLPKDVIVKDAFPRSGTGKIQKTVLRQEV
ncbi:AMP-binding protein [Brevibacterium litoralis]|uniref:AMP-binding protein n=1 Tax=Brevibacterium litoralis TaxID=3138935 RepID=UPI0032EC8547